MADGSVFSSTNILFVILGCVLTLVFGLLKNILWSGLKRLFPDQEPPPLIQALKPNDNCKECICLDRIKACESCIVTMKKDGTEYRKDIEYIKDRLDKSDVRMDKSEKQMAKMGESISSIDRSLSRLVTIVEERTKAMTHIDLKGIRE